jgi:hypothetical protein
MLEFEEEDEEDEEDEEKKKTTVHIYLLLHGRPWPSGCTRNI